MKRSYIKEIKKLVGERVKVKGFIENLRISNHMVFIVLRDISGKVQITYKRGTSSETDYLISHITNDSFITVEGTILENSHVKMGGIEVMLEIMVIESIAEPLPIVRKELTSNNKKKALEKSSIDQRLNYRWIDLRSEENQLLLKVQTSLSHAIRNYLLNKNFIEIHTPKIIKTASESGSDVFEVKYFDEIAYLAQSPQFYKQMAMASGLEKIFEIGPVFRAEKSYSNRHATEFTGLDIEISYIDSYLDVMRLEEKLLMYVLEQVSDKYKDEIKKLYGHDLIVPTTPFPVISLSDLYKCLDEEFGYKIPDNEKNDLTTEAEKLSYDWVKKNYNHEFLFVTDFRPEKRAFYHMRNENNIPQGYDLIWKGVEISTGAQREHRLERLKSQAKEKGLIDDVKFYFDFFRYGCPPHGGFGLGLDRLTMLIFNLNIKEAMFLFRGPSRLTP